MGTPTIRAPLIERSPNSNIEASNELFDNCSDTIARVNAELPNLF